MPISTNIHEGEFCIVYVTTANDTEAKSLAGVVITERLAACANILGEIQSLYWWNGEIQQEPECALLLKTRKDLFAQLEQRICELHSYECPCIIALPISNGAVPFLNWIHEQTQKPAST